MTLKYVQVLYSPKRIKVSHHSFQVLKPTKVDRPYFKKLSGD